MTQAAYIEAVEPTILQAKTSKSASLVFCLNLKRFRIFLKLSKETYRIYILFIFCLNPKIYVYIYTYILCLYKIYIDIFYVYIYFIQTYNI